MLKDEEELIFGSIQKSYLLKVLSCYNLSAAFYSINILLKENKSYIRLLYDKIFSEIQALNKTAAFNPTEYHTLNRVIGLFLIELRDSGYSKEYLHRFIRSIFSSSTPAADFDTVYKIIESLITRNTEKYTVYIAFKVPKSAQNHLKIKSSELSMIDYHVLKTEAAKINQAFERYVQQYSTLQFYKMEIECRDYLHAGYVARQKLQQILDIVFMGYSRNMIHLHKYCFVVGANDPSKGNRQALDFQLDGHFRSEQALYVQFVQKINDLATKPMESISLSKLFSGLRYLRLGTVADELENKLLNYWIAIEYLFSSAEGEQDKVKRLRDYFKKTHSIAYASRLFNYVHKSVKRLNLQTVVTKYNNADLQYLLEPQTKTELIANATQNPLIAYRIFVLIERFKNIDSCKKELERHQNNLDRNIIRIYRLRNEIVHNAARERNIQDVTAHLRYYLTFIINGFIDFALNNPTDINRDGKISLDDYFTVMTVQLDSLLMDDSLTINKLLQFKNPIEYLS